jgi:hypothetical protein
LDHRVKSPRVPRVLGHRAESPRGHRVLAHREGSLCLGPTSQVSNVFSCLGPSSPVSTGSYCLGPSGQVSKESSCLGPTSQVSEGFSGLGPSSQISKRSVSWANESSLQEVRFLGQRAKSHVLGPRVQFRRGACLVTTSQVSKRSSCLGPSSQVFKGSSCLGQSSRSAPPHTPTQHLPTNTTPPRHTWPHDSADVYVAIIVLRRLGWTVQFFPVSVGGATWQWKFGCASQVSANRQRHQHEL